ncbi:MAG: insulinase family protein [Bacteroidales bacterium]|nr:insulinase family protein [Bacteroidales bacterium]
MNYKVHILSNGIRVVHLPVISPVSHCGILINAGSRDENDNEHGIAHFIEHVIFKGTKKRKAYHILSRLDDVGGEINAYTTKEETAFYAAFLKPDFDRALELLADILFNSVFPKAELEKEKDVVIDEINSYKDSPSELIFDDIEEIIFKGHPIGRNILGTPGSIHGFSKESIQAFMTANYHTDQMVFCSVGSQPFSKIVKLSEKYLGAVPANLSNNKRKQFDYYHPSQVVQNHNTHQAHCIIGNLAYNALDKRRMDLVLLNNLLGGQGLNSRLNMSLREKHGYAYSVESSFTPYLDTGILTIYFGTDKDNLNKSIDLVHKELKKLRETKLGSMQLHRAKKQIIGQMAMSADNKENLLFSMGKSFMLFNRFDSLETMNRRIEAISAERLQEVANEILNPNQLSQLVYK